MTKTLAQLRAARKAKEDAIIRRRVKKALARMSDGEFINFVDGRSKWCAQPSCCVRSA